MDELRKISPEDLAKVQKANLEVEKAKSELEKVQLQVKNIELQYKLMIANLYVAYGIKSDESIKIETGEIVSKDEGQK